MIFSNSLVVIRGGGDLATGVAYRLHKAGFPIIVLDGVQWVSKLPAETATAAVEVVFRKVLLVRRFFIIFVCLSVSRFHCKIMSHRGNCSGINMTARL